MIDAVRAALGDAVKDVRASERLTSSAVCLVSDEGDMSLHLERLLRQHRRDGGEKAARILELNPRHALIVRLAKAAAEGSSEKLTDAAWLLFDQARLVEGEPPSDPVAFARRLASMLERALSRGRKRTPASLLVRAAEGGARLEKAGNPPHNPGCTVMSITIGGLIHQ